MGANSLQQVGRLSHRSNRQEVFQAAYTSPLPQVTQTLEFSISADMKAVLQDPTEVTSIQFWYKLCGWKMIQFLEALGTWPRP